MGGLFGKAPDMSAQKKRIREQQKLANEQKMVLRRKASKEKQIEGARTNAILAQKEGPGLGSGGFRGVSTTLGGQ